MIRTLAVIVMAASIAGCALRYAEPVYEPDSPELRFPGIHSLLDDGHTTRVLWIHGMCHHDADWAKARMERLAKLLGGSYDAEAFGKPVRVPGTPVEIYAGEITAPRGKAAIQLIVWSALTLEDKRTLCYETIPSGDSAKICGEKTDYGYERATLNNLLKSEIMNACLSDAMLYAGLRGGTMRDAMVRTVCVAAGGRPTGTGCQRADQPEIERSPLVIVAESLGSKMLVDAVLALKQSPAGARTVQRALSGTRMIYLLANQIPILDLATTPGATARSVDDKEGLRGLVEAIRPKDSRESFENLFVVAFSDPNDILSYRLRKDYFSERDDVRLVNVIASNTRTFLNLASHPARAHQRYVDRAASVVMVCGNQTSDPCPARR